MNDVQVVKTVILDTSIQDIEKLNILIVPLELDVVMDWSGDAYAYESGGLAIANNEECPDWLKGKIDTLIKEHGDQIMVRFVNGHEVDN